MVYADLKMYEHIGSDQPEKADWSFWATEKAFELRVGEEQAGP